jgi:hypothetical protein
LSLFTGVNAPYLGGHPGFERFAEGSSCYPVVGLVAIRPALLISTSALRNEGNPT